MVPTVGLACRAAFDQKARRFLQRTHIMKVNLLDAHDRLLIYNKQKDYISEGCRDCISQRPKEFGNHSFYIFAHARTDDDGVTKRLIWQPRLVKPKAQTNSMLFKAYPPSDKINVIWILPPREQWKQFEKDNLTQSKEVVESIYNFKNKRELLEAREEDDLLDYQIYDIYEEISRNSNFRKTLKPDS